VDADEGEVYGDTVPVQGDSTADTITQTDMREVKLACRSARLGTSKLEVNRAPLMTSLELN